MEFEVAKVDRKEQLVFGFFNITKVGDEEVVDLQGDVIPTAELEKAAYKFVMNARVMGQDHVMKGVGDLVESIMFTYEKQAAIAKSLKAMGIDATLELNCEGWFGGFKVSNPKAWESIDNGERLAWSIGGVSKREP